MNGMTAITNVPSNSQEANVLPARLVDSIRRSGEATEETVRLAESLSRDCERWGLPKSWLGALTEALKTNNWDLLDKGFLDFGFLGENGSFLIIGPYTVSREGEVETRLSGIYGRVLPHPPMPPLDQTLLHMFRSVSQVVTRILPISVEASCGNIGGEAGEAFVVPDGWGFRSSASGPALNDMDEQYRRFSEAGQECVKRIFEGGTADLLLRTYQDKEMQIQVQHQEYQFHEAGHASGIGLTKKLQNQLLTTWWHGAVEEWRADGIAFEVAARLLTEEGFGRLVASNLCTRFGMDAHRIGGPDRDRDVAASLLTMDQLLRGGAFVIKDRKLALKDRSYRGLTRATVPHRIAAMQLTEAEAALEYEIGVHGRYGSISVEESSRAIFDGLVREPCRGIFKELR